ncbi:MAG TPA: MOSC domain-containing protein [Actinomycetota bacterium]|nr:MOSC domain-containing protein [Actinomycetota bacterium]
MIVGRVSELWWYPVKSCLGQQFDRLTVRQSGIPGDRGFALADVSSGRVLSAKRVHQLVSARTEGTDVVLPDGRRVAPSDPSAGTILSSWLGRDVRVVRATGGDTRPEMEGEEDTIFRGEAGGLHDDSPIHIVTSSTLAYLRTLYSGGDYDARRFRPNIVIDTGDAEGPVEQTWIGKVLRIGAAEFDVTKTCHRCVITTLPQWELPHDPAILRTVNQQADGECGVYLRARAEAEVAVGDKVSF